MNKWNEFPWHKKLVVIALIGNCIVWFFVRKMHDPHLDTYIWYTPLFSIMYLWAEKKQKQKNEQNENESEEK